MSALTGAAWERVRDGSSDLDPAAFSGWVSGVNLTAEGTAAFVQQQRVAARYFQTLGMPPAMGREFEAAEDVPGGPAVAVLSHELWERTFHSDPAIVGTAIRLKGEPHTVVGVMPPGFESSVPADVWTPLRPSRTGEGGGANYEVVARLPKGMSWDVANAQLGGLAQPESEGGSRSRFGLIPLNRGLTWEMRQPLLMLLGAVVLMLLVGSANLAGLQIARALARRPENRHSAGSGRGNGGDSAADADREPGPGSHGRASRTGPGRRGTGCAPGPDASPFRHLAVVPSGQARPDRGCRAHGPGHGGVRTCARAPGSAA